MNRFALKAPLRVVAIGSAFVLISSPSPGADKPSQPAAAERLNAVDPETRLLIDRAGTWDVVITFQPSADAKAAVTSGVVAERRMVGRSLAENMHPASNSGAQPFERTAYLQYSSVEGRWQYVSLDTRFPVGIMPAYSFDKGAPDKVTLEFAPIGFVGMGAQVDGKMLRSNLVITHAGPDHDVVEQFAITSDGTGRKWRLVEYDYKRRR
jgi:hypothetical protein